MIWPSHELLKTNKVIVYNGKSNAINLGLDKTKQISQKPRVISLAREEWTSPVPSWSANSKSYLWQQGLYWKYVWNSWDSDISYGSTTNEGAQNR